MNIKVMDLSMFEISSSAGWSDSSSPHLTEFKAPLHRADSWRHQPGLTMMMMMMIIMCVHACACACLLPTVRWYHDAEKTNNKNVPYKKSKVSEGNLSAWCLGLWDDSRTDLSVFVWRRSRHGEKVNTSAFPVKLLKFLSSACSMNLSERLKRFLTDVTQKERIKKSIWFLFFKKTRRNNPLLCDNFTHIKC